MKESVNVVLVLTFFQHYFSFNFFIIVLLFRLGTIGFHDECLAGDKRSLYHPEQKHWFSLPDFCMSTCSLSDLTFDKHQEEDLGTINRFNIWLKHILCMSQDRTYPDFQRHVMMSFFYLMRYGERWLFVLLILLDLLAITV